MSTITLHGAFGLGEPKKLPSCQAVAEEPRSPQAMLSPYSSRPSSAGGATWGLTCSSVLGSIFYSLRRKQVITQKQLHSSLQVSRMRQHRLITGVPTPRPVESVAIIGDGDRSPTKKTNLSSEPSVPDSDNEGVHAVKP